MSAFTLPTRGQTQWDISTNAAFSNLDGRVSRLALDVKEFGLAVGDGVTDDTAAILNTLNAASPGQRVFLPALTYLISTPLVVPPGVILCGGGGLRTELAATTTVTHLKMSAGFTGAAAIYIVDKEIGGYPTDNASVQIRDINIDCSAKTSGTVDGIQVNGKCDGLLIEGVSIYKPPNAGLRMLQYTRVDTSIVKSINAVLRRVVVHNSGSDAFSFNGNTDCEITSCYTLGSGGEGFVLTTSCANTVLAGCRAEWSTLNGFHVTGNWNTGTGSGGMEFVGCSTDRNNRNGYLIDSTGTSPINIAAPMCRRDGRNGGSGGGSYAAIAVASATTPVLVTNPTVFPGLDDNGSGTNSPQYGVNISGSTYVAVGGGGYLHAATTAFNTDTTTVVSRGPGIAERTGSTNAPSSITVDDWTRPEWTPADVSWKAWNYDSQLTATTGALTTAVIKLIRLKVRKTMPITNIVVFVNQAGTSITAGQSFAGLYSVSGGTATKLDVTADQAAAWAGTGIKTMPLVGGAQTLAPGDYIVALVSTFTGTAPGFAMANRINNAQLMNGALGASGARYATNGTGTSLPTTFTLSANVVAADPIWVALS